MKTRKYQRRMLAVARAARANDDSVLFELALENWRKAHKHEQVCRDAYRSIQNRFASGIKQVEFGGES